MNAGEQVKFRNGEIVTIQRIIVDEQDFVTCNPGMNTVHIQGKRETFVLEFDDGEITIGNRTEIEPI